MRLIHSDLADLCKTITVVLSHLHVLNSNAMSHYIKCITNKSVLIIAITLGTKQILFTQKLAKRPNILMLCIDDMNDWYGFLGGHPEAKTPHMDKLAAKGVNFTNAHCTAPGCSPSRNAIMLGAEPHNLGLYPFYKLENVDSAEMAPYTALPHLLCKNDYTTCGITKVYHNPDNTWQTEKDWDEYTNTEHDTPSAFIILNL